MTTFDQTAAPPRLSPKYTTWTPKHSPVFRWHPATMLAFRLCFVYFGLYVLTTQMLAGLIPIPGLNVPDLGTIPVARAVVLWVGAHILHLSQPISVASSGSGDKTYDWVQSFTLLLIAIVSTIAWSIVHRTRYHHESLFRWFRLYIRVALATTLFSYGFVKVFPLQMPVLALTRLVEPFGNFSPMGVLWYSIGAAPGYEMFIGSAEVGAGLLLFLPRTATLGAMVALMDSIGVFAVNMTYDVPVKLFSFHLILMSVFLLAPNIPRLIDIFLLQRLSEIRVEPPIGNTRGARRGWVAAQIVFAVWSVGLNAFGGMQNWKTRGGGAPKSPLYGIWDVEQMTVDGQPRAALLSDTTRWRRIIFQRPTAATFQRPNDTFKGFTAVIDTNANTLTLTSADSGAAKSPLKYHRDGKERLLIDGTMDGHVVHFDLAFRDPDLFLQRSRGFHFVQEVPFNK